jgi:hypothetical protein
LTTLDVFRSHHRDEIVVLMTGQASAPTVVDRDTGARVTLEPMVLVDNAILFTIVPASGRPADAWTGSLPITPGASETRLEVIMDGCCQRCVVRWPEERGPDAGEIVH